MAPKKKPHSSSPLQPTQSGFLEKNDWYNVIRYQVVPPFFLFLFTGAVQFLALMGRGETPCPFDFQQCHRVHGNQFSWAFVGVFTLWAMASLWIPSKIYIGPATPDGYRPHYSANGLPYFFVTLFAYGIFQVLYPSLSTEIYENMPEILGCFNHTALLLCAWLLYSGRKTQKDNEKKPLIYDFYRGCELHPRLFGCDVKQLTNCRIGMMLWQTLNLAFFIADYHKTGFSPGGLVTLLLQTIYLTKFFHWETGYFNTLDITYDRAGYYLCWGCLVWVPSLYTFHSYHQVAFPSTLSYSGAFVTFLCGLSFVLLNYRVDYEKETFAAWYQNYLKNKSKAGKCYLWGKPVTYVETKYKNSQGEEKRSALLTSGFWGLARHDNYTFELLCALCWCLPASIGHGAFPLLYFFFLVFLLVHRIYRDEDKCSAKYGPYWNTYCKEVPYRMIPYVY